ncbi:MAG: serine/threonine-protein kinase, partial [Bacteroidota bacterium]
MIGRQLLHYVIEGKLGEGGMGVVYKGTDTLLRRPVAMKFLTKALPADAAERKRFLREARSAATISHPNVCVVHAIEEAEGQQFLVMEFVEGVTLRKWAARKRAQAHASALPIRDALTLGIQIASGLEAAHKKGIVHRDVKPENIMVNDEDHAKIMDFGLAKLVGESRLTRTGATVGTVAYMSPEQVQGGEIDQQSDVYSFGVVLYEMLAGTTPFQAEHAMGMMYAIVNSEPDPILKRRREVGEELGRIVMKCLAREKKARYAGMREIIEELGALKEGHETVVARTAGRTVRGIASSRWTGRAATVGARKGILWKGVAIVVLVAAALLLVRREAQEGGQWISVSSDPPGSQVWINGREVGLAPLEHVLVPEGRVALRLLLASYHPVDTSV